MSREESELELSDRERWEGASYEIAQEVSYWMFEFAEANAESIANYESRDPFNEGRDLRRSMAEQIYYTAEEEIEAVLSQNDLTQYQDEVQKVCVEELSERFAELIGRFSDSGRPGPVELAIEEEAKPLKAVLASVITVVFAEPERIAERQRWADERRRKQAAEWRRLRAQKRSRSWWSAVKDFFSW